MHQWSYLSLCDLKENKQSKVLCLGMCDKEERKEQQQHDWNNKATFAAAASGWQMENGEANPRSHRAAFSSIG